MIPPWSVMFDTPGDDTFGNTPSQPPTTATANRHSDRPATTLISDSQNWNSPNTAKPGPRVDQRGASR